MSSATALIVCLFMISLLHATANGRSIQSFDGGSDHTVKKQCPQCTQRNPLIRDRRDTTSMLADLAAQFLARGGLQAVSELATSNDKIGVLKRILGSQVQMEVLRQLIGRLSGYGNRGNTGSVGGGGYVAPPLAPTGDGRYEPTGGSGAAAATRKPASGGSAGGAGNAVNPDDTEY